MKEATGELNMTVITVVAIAAIAAIVYTFVWPAIRRSIENRTCVTACGTDNTCLTECRKDANNAINIQYN